MQAVELPSVVAIEYLHRQHARDEARFTLVFTHCEAVWDIAHQLITEHHLAVDAKLVRAGALLHDIGVYDLEPNEPYIHHGLVGSWLLQKAGFSEQLCRFASHHTGAGLTREDIETEKLPLPIKDFVPETAEERLVAYADKFHSKTDPPRFNALASIRKDLGKYGASKVARFEAWCQEFGEPDLKPLAEAFGHKIS